MTKITNAKATIYPTMLRLQETDRPFAYDYKNKAKKTKIKSSKLMDPKTCNQKSKARLKSTVYSNAFAYKNASGLPIPLFFATFTFAKNITDLKLAHKIYKKFIQRLSYLAETKIKYLAMPEFQKRGAVHYHVLFFNLPYIKNIFLVLSKCWGQGFVLMKTVNDIEHAINYISKYIQKEMGNKHEKFQKRFLTSKGLHKAEFLRDKNEICELLKSLPLGYTLEESDYIGTDGTKYHDTKFHYPAGTDLTVLLKDLPLDVIELAKKTFGVVK